jgi:hypothetical protein
VVLQKETAECLRSNKKNQDELRGAALQEEGPDERDRRLVAMEQLVVQHFLTRSRGRTGKGSKSGRGQE